MVQEHISVLYLIGSTLKFPVLTSKVWFSALARPNPTVRTDRIKVRSLPKTKRTAHSVNLAKRNKRYVIYQNSSTNCVTHIFSFRYLYALCTKFTGRIILPAKKKHFLKHYQERFFCIWCYWALARIWYNIAIPHW